MTRTLIHTFDDLPLLTDGPYSMARVSGQAEIAYTDDVIDFEVTDVWLSGDRRAVYSDAQKLTAKLTDQHLPLHIYTMARVHDDVIYRMIVSLLEGTESEAVHECIREHIEGEREYAADHKRDSMMEMGR